MSTINSYFNTRKSRSNTKNDTSAAALIKKEGTITSHFAAQAPQPTYNEVNKPIITTTTPKRKSKEESTATKKNSILYYLSPMKKTVERTAEKEIVETTIPCQIRSIIPVASIWNCILEEFDPDSHTNQLTAHDSPTPSPTTSSSSNEKMLPIENMEITNTMNTARRRRLEDDNDCMTRNVRIRTRPTVFCLEEYLLEDVKEDLSRPLRTQYSLKQSNTFLMGMIDEILYIV